MKKSPKSKLWLSLTVGASVFFSSQVAWADPSSTGNVGAQVVAKPIGHLVDIEGGEIDMKKKDAELKVGYGSSTSAERLTSISGSAQGTKLYAGKNPYGFRDGPVGKYWGVIDPSVSARADIALGSEGQKAELKRLNIEAGSFKTNLDMTTEDASEKPGFVAQGTLFPFLPNATGVVSLNKFNDSKSYGGVISVFDPSLKGAFKVEGRQIEIYHSARPGLVIGQTKVGQEDATILGLRADLKAGASIDLAALGKLGYEVNYTVLGNKGSAHSVEQSVYLKNIGKSPIFVQGTHTVDQSYSKDSADNAVAKGATTQMVYLGVAAK